MLRRWLLQKTCKVTWLRRGVRRAARCPDEGTSTASSSCTGDPEPPRAPSHCNSLMPFNETPKHAEKVIASPQRTTSVSDLSALVMRIRVQQQEPATALPTTVPTVIFPDQPRCRRRPTNVDLANRNFSTTDAARTLAVGAIKTSASVFAVDNPHPKLDL